tara:strand:- start:212 stop:352 length:141 start_codon:yes stop_codon:yes gene_type:complete
MNMEIMVMVELVLFPQHLRLGMHPDHHHLLHLLLVDHYIRQHHHRQ